MNPNAYYPVTTLSSRYHRIEISNFKRQCLFCSEPAFYWFYSVSYNDNIQMYLFSQSRCMDDQKISFEDTTLFFTQHVYHHQHHHTRLCIVRLRTQASSIVSYGRRRHSFPRHLNTLRTCILPNVGGRPLPRVVSLCGHSIVLLAQRSQWIRAMCPALYFRRSMVVVTIFTALVFCLIHSLRFIAIALLRSSIVMPSIALSNVLCAICVSAEFLVSMPYVNTGKHWLYAFVFRYCGIFV